MRRSVIEGVVLAGFIAQCIGTPYGAPRAPRAKERMGQIVKITARAGDMLGGNARAISRFRFQPFAGFDRRAAEELFSLGEGEAVLN